MNPLKRLCRDIASGDVLGAKAIEQQIRREVPNAFDEEDEWHEREFQEHKRIMGRRDDGK